MTHWRKVLGLLAHDAERHFDRLRFRLQDRLHLMNPVVILPYRGHGTQTMFYLRGRVIQNHGLPSARDNDSVWQNLLNMYRRFATDEMPGVRVQARFGAATQTAVTDSEGFFALRFAPDPALLRPDRYWYEVELSLLEYPGPRLLDARFVAQVVVPPADAEYAVISDLDDTVIRSDVINLVKLARNTFLNNARTRLPFEGVAAFYQALQAGTRGRYNPIYYVSSSPWNLYDLLSDFFDVRGIPQGAMFLTDLGLTSDYLIRPDRRMHKLGAIHTLLDTHPSLPFILIGDSGEIDPEIYLEAVRAHPGRILAVYIRDVSGATRDASIEPIAAAVRAAGSELLLVADTVAAAVHASTHGYILPEALPRISEERSADKTAPNPVEQALDEGSL